MVQLRGTLFVYIASAKKLFNADSSFFGLTKNKSDPYVKVTIGETRICKTRVSWIMDESCNKALEQTPSTAFQFRLPSRVYFLSLFPYTLFLR